MVLSMVVTEGLTCLDRVLQVLKVEELVKPRMAEEKRKMVQQVREETTEAAIATVKAKLKEQAEAEAAAREEGENNM